MTQSLPSVFPPPMILELFIKDLESECHDEGTADDHEDHVEEEMSVVVVSDTVVEPGTVMVHVENTSVANTAVMGSRGLRSDTLLTDTGDLLQHLVSGGLAWRRQEGHEEMEDDVDEEIVTHHYQHPEKINIFVFQVVRKTNPVYDEYNRRLEEKFL